MPEIAASTFTLSDGAVDVSVKQVDAANDEQKEAFIAALSKHPKNRAIFSTAVPASILTEKLDCVTVTVPDLQARKADIPSFSKPCCATRYVPATWKCPRFRSISK